MPGWMKQPHCSAAVWLLLWGFLFFFFCGLVSPDRRRGALPLPGQATPFCFLHVVPRTNSLICAADQFLDLALDNFLVQLYNLLGHGLQSPFRMVCRNFILPEFCKPCLFFPPFNLRNLSDLLTKKKSELKVDAFSSDFQRTRGQKDSPDHPF